MRAPRRIAAAVVVAFATTIAAACADQPAAPLAVAGCSSSQLRVTTEAVDGAHDGTSRDGRNLVIENTSAAACSVAPFITLTFLDRDRAPTTIAEETPNPFAGPIVDGRRLPLGHGPVALPTVLPSNARVFSALQWIDAPVAANGVCVDTAFVALVVAGGSVEAPLHAHVCGPDARRLTVTVRRLSVATDTE